MAVLIERYFGSAFSLDSLRQVLGLVAAAITGTAVAAIGGTVGVVLVQGSTAPALTIWYHWLASNVPAIVAVAPLLIGLASAVRDPPPRRLSRCCSHCCYGSQPAAGPSLRRQLHSSLP
jgi:integral membrane sensor domain MASE1